MGYTYTDKVIAVHRSDGYCPEAWEIMTDVMIGFVMYYRVVGTTDGKCNWEILKFHEIRLLEM